MSISKSPLIFAALLCAAVSLRADDNAAQAAARAALMQKMQDLDSQQGSPDASNNQPPENQAAVPPPAETPAPVAPENNAGPTPPPSEPPPPAAPETQPAPAQTQPSAPAAANVEAAPTPDANQSNFSAPPQTTGGDNSAQAATRAALLAHEMELANQQPTNAPPPAAVEASSPMPAELPPTMQQPEPSPMPSSANRPGFFSRLFHSRPSRAANNSAVVEVKRMNSSARENIQNRFGFTPIQPPAPPVSPEKDAELHALLERYEADQITPEQYQAQRAEIINSP